MGNLFHNARIVGDRIDSEAYVRDPHPRGHPEYVMTRSELLNFAACPSRWIKGYKRKISQKAERFGNLVDTLFLMPGSFGQRYAIRPETYPSDDGEKKWNLNAKWCKQWVKDNAKAKTLLSAEEYSEGKKAAASLGNIRAVHPGGFKVQVMVIGEYQDPATKLVIPVKALLDLVPTYDQGDMGRSLLEVKTDRNASHFVWPKTVFDKGYHVQAAMHTALFTAATGEDRNTFRWLIVESVFPFEPNFEICSAGFMDLGRTAMINALQYYAQSVKTGHWPTYAEQSRNVYSGWALCEPEAFMSQRTLHQMATIEEPDDDGNGDAEDVPH